MLNFFVSHDHPHTIHLHLLLSGQINCPSKSKQMLNLWIKWLDFVLNQAENPPEDSLTLKIVSRVSSSIIWAFKSCHSLPPCSSPSIYLLVRHSSLPRSEGSKLWQNKVLACSSSHTIWQCLDTSYLTLSLEFVFQVCRITCPSREGKVSVRRANLIEIDPFISYQTRTKQVDGAGKLTM